ncbi:MAG TPA: site-2 protease family protein [Thermoanaerobaculia bacterium]|nr:site-2 protease family protein [Thermoanaerobaculia bacterium]
MFGRKFRLFTVFGIPIGVDPSWLVVAVLVTWSLASSYFPMVSEGLEQWLYWTMGVAGALGLFTSVILHELGHSVVAQRYGLEIRGITLFLFGGVAELAEEPPNPRAELWVAIAGPVVSALLALSLFGVFVLAGPWLPGAALSVVGYLATINLMLVLFNLVPAMPLDGGRILRAVLWARSGNLRRATRISSQIGGVFGLVLIGLGVLAFMRGNFIAGMWWFLIGLFLRSAAASSYQHVLVRRALEGEPVRRFMQTEPVAVPRAISVRELVEEYVYRYHFKMFPVVEGDRLIGCVSTREIKGLAHDEWDLQTVGAIAKVCGEDTTLRPDDDAMDALSKMSRTGASRMMVVEDGDRLVGILALKDLLKFLSLKIELEGDQPAAVRSEAA